MTAIDTTTTTASSVTFNGLTGGDIYANGTFAKGSLTPNCGATNTYYFFLVLLIGSLCACKGSRAEAEANSCIVSLKVIEDAKREWAKTNDKKLRDEVKESDIHLYFKGGMLPTCESGGTYTIGSVGRLPACSIPGHVLRSAETVK